MSIIERLKVLGSDIRYAARGFLRTPLFTLVAVSAVAIGVGAGAAVFSVVDRILFRSLPYPDADRLVSFGMAAPIVPQEFMLAYDYLDWRTVASPFESLVAWSGVSDCDLSDTNPVRLRCAYVDASLLPALAVRPILGRNFTSAEDRPNAPKGAIISHGLWRSRFGGDLGVVGRLVPLDGQMTTVVGVLPAGFELPSLAAADLLVPLALDEALQRTRQIATLLFAVGRLKPGVTVPQAAAELQPLFERSLESVSPDFRNHVKLRLRPLRDRQIQDSRRASWILLASVAAVLLITCSNVANLLLARSASRRSELVVRAALGASRARLVCQALTESVLLGVVGGAVGCLLASALLRVFVAVAPDGIPRLNQAGVDARVLLLTLSVSLLSGVLFGLAPAYQSPAVESLTGWRTSGPSHRRFQHGLVTVQICVSLILLTGAGSLLHSLWNLLNQPLGMRTDNVMAATVTLGRRSCAEPARRMFPGEDPLLKQLRPGRVGPWLSVVGVAGNVKNGSLLQRDDPEFYMIRKHSPQNVRLGAAVILRGSIDPRNFAEVVRAEVAAMDPALPVSIDTLRQRAGRWRELWLA